MEETEVDEAVNETEAELVEETMVDEEVKVAVSLYCEVAAAACWAVATKIAAKTLGLGTVPVILLKTMH